MTAYINKLKDKTGNQQLPVTHERAVRDDNGTTAETKFQNLEGAMDKAYVAQSDNGMGRITLKKNMVGVVNTLTQTMMQATNTIYVIRYDFTLGEDITIPANCILEFDGGSLNGNNTITFRSTRITGAPIMNVTPAGSIDGNIHVNWFGLKPNDVNYDNAPIIQKIGRIYSNIIIDNGYYYCKTPIDWTNKALRSVISYGTLHYLTQNTNEDFIKLTAFGGEYYFNNIEGPNSNIGDGDVNEKSVGINFLDCNNCNIRVNRVQGFYNNVKISSTTYGNAYNSYDFGIIQIGKILVNIDSETNGWINSNQYYFHRLTSYGNTTIPEAAIKFTGYQFGSNDNIVYECNIEGINSNPPIQIFSLGGYIFKSIRNEGNHNYFLQVDNTISDCLFNFDYGYNNKIYNTGGLNHIMGVKYSYRNNNIDYKYEVDTISYVKGESTTNAAPFVNWQLGSGIDNPAFRGSKSNIGPFGFIVFDKSELSSKAVQLDYGWKSMAVSICYYDSSKQLINVEDYQSAHPDINIIPCGRNVYQPSGRRFYSQGSTLEQSNIYFPELPNEVAYVGIGLSDDATSMENISRFPYLKINAKCSGDIHSVIE